MKRICSILRCSKKEGMYLYVDKSAGIESIPDKLRRQLGDVELAMTLMISEDKKLARANAKEVLQAIRENGFYLQMPPTLHSAGDTEMKNLRNKNSKLS
jgi:uncharacterized protein YcgL (UPF0745 family)